MRNCFLKSKFHLPISTFVLCLLFYCPGSQASAPGFFLPGVYDGSQNIDGWVMSEKLDGVRALWDGQKLVSRGGKPLHAPLWFTDGLPPFALDGELWSRRCDFENIVSIVRKKIPDQRWEQISYSIFEIPDQPGTLEERLAVLQIFLEQHPAPWLRVIPQIKIKDKNHLHKSLLEITENGGEGLIIRDPSQLFQTGRLSSLLKLKFHLEDECRVRKILPGKGKHKGRMGALQCEMGNGRLIKIGTGFSDAERSRPPPPDTVILFRYYGFTKYNNPRFPVYLHSKH